MTHMDIVNTILFLRPKAEFVLRDGEIEWLDINQTQPTEKEITDGFVAYTKKLEDEAILAKTKHEELLARLGITAEEAKLLLS